jgi:hypothetical protein
MRTGTEVGPHETQVSGSDSKTQEFVKNAQKCVLSGRVIELTDPAAWWTIDGETSYAHVDEWLAQSEEFRIDIRNRNTFCNGMVNPSLARIDNRKANTIATDRINAARKEKIEAARE